MSVDRESTRLSLLLSAIKRRHSRGIEKWVFGCRHTPNRKQHAGYPIPEMNINGASKICCHAFWIIQGLFNDICPHLTYWPPVNPKMLMTTLPLPPKIESLWDVNNFWACILHNPMAVQWHSSIFQVSAAFQMKNASKDNATIFQNWASMECQQFLVLHLE